MEYDATYNSGVDKQRTNIYGPSRHKNSDNNDIEIVKYDPIYVEHDNIELNENKNTVNNINGHKMALQRFDTDRNIRTFEEKKSKAKKRVKRYDDDARCEYFNFNDKDPSPSIWHPHDPNSKTYFNNSYCVTIINGKFYFGTFFLSDLFLFTLNIMMDESFS